MPDTITGFLPGRGPLDAAYSQQFLIERAHSKGDVLSGVSLDLEKCFNTIFRSAAAAALIKIGIPPRIVHQWHGSLSG
jgi:hypothetical protein